MPLITSFKAAARAARAKVMVKALKAGCPSPQGPPANHSPHTPWVSASVRVPVYRP